MVRRRLTQTSNVRSIYVLYPGGLKRKLKEIRVIITRNGKRSALNDTITRAKEQHLTLRVICTTFLLTSQFLLLLLFSFWHLIHKNNKCRYFLVKFTIFFVHKTYSNTKLDHINPISQCTTPSSICLCLLQLP